MLNSINEYTISDKITTRRLRKNNFKKSANLDFYYRIITVTDDIDLFLKIFVDEYKHFYLTDESINMIDSSFGHLYYPFYEDKSFKYLDNVIKKYNEIMDQLIYENILKRDVKVKKKSL